MDAIYKFGWIPEQEQRYEFPNVFAVEATSGPKRLIIAPSANHISIMIDLLQVMSAPFRILYVLAVPRAEGEPGRYQAATPVPRHVVEEFLKRFRDFFEHDGRHHLWVAATSSSDLLVYDKHNVIYAYGQLPEFEQIALNCGMARADSVQFPSPHIHKFNAAFDLEQQEVLRYWEWKHTPLREDDY